MRNIFPPKRKADLLSDAVPWRNMMLPGLILHKKQHGLQRSYRVRGPDLQGVSLEEQGALMLQANEVLKRLGGQWMLQSEAQRTQVKSLPKVAWPLIVPELIDEEHRAKLLGTPGSRETRYFLTLSWVPPMLTPEKGLRFLIKGPPRPDHHDARPGAPGGVAARVSEPHRFLSLICSRACWRSVARWMRSRR